MNDGYLPSVVAPLNVSFRDINNNEHFACHRMDVGTHEAIK